MNHFDLLLIGVILLLVFTSAEYLTVIPNVNCSTCANLSHINNCPNCVMIKPDEDSGCSPTGEQPNTSSVSKFCSTIQSYSPSYWPNYPLLN